MKEKKTLKLSDVFVTSIGAIFWIIASCYHIQILANTTTLILMIGFAAYWNLSAVLKIVKYLKQSKQGD